MRKIVLLLVIGVVSLFANDIISTGKKSGSYYPMGIKISKLVGGLMVEKSKGSTMNLEKVAKGEAAFGIVQKDDFAHFLKTNPEAPIELIGDLKQECLYVVGSSSGKVDSDSDIQSKGIKVAIGKKGSGTQATWRYMKQLESGFGKATGVPKGGLRALAGITSGLYDVALFMQTPSTNNKLVKTVLQNKDLKFIPVTDWDLNDKLPSGKPVYKHEKIDLKSNFFNDTELKTICTTASVIANTNTDEDLIDDVIGALLDNKNYIVDN